MSVFSSLVPFLPIAIIVIAFLLIIACGYVKAPPDTAFIISGLRKRTIIGKASIRFLS